MPPGLSIWRNPIHLLAFGFGSGLSPWAPGTFGTAVAVLLYVLFPPLHWSVYLLMLLVTFILGIWLCGRTSRDMGVHDHGGIVWDEFVGYWATMFMAPADWQWVYDPTVPTNRKVRTPYVAGKSFITLIDFFLISPNVRARTVKGLDQQFRFSDHQPVWMEVELR